jgi:1,4-dihydroxy-2-naphthoate octaprenyltransferase
LLVVCFAFIGGGFIFLSMDYDSMASAIQGLTTSLLCFVMAGLVLFIANIKKLITQ